jgi:hypothetical protein
MPQACRGKGSRLETQTRLAAAKGRWKENGFSGAKRHRTGLPSCHMLKSWSQRHMGKTMGN